MARTDRRRPAPGHHPQWDDEPVLAPVREATRPTAAVSFGRLILHPGALVGFTTSLVLITMMGLSAAYSGLPSLSGAVWAMGWVTFVALFHHEVAHAIAARVLCFEVLGWGIRPHGAYVLVVVPGGP